MMFNSWEFSDNEFKRQKPGHKRPMRMTGCRESLHRQQHYLILVLLACCFLYPLTATAGNGFPRGDYYNQSPSSEILSYIPNCPSGDTEDTERFTDVPAGWFALGLRPDIANDGQYIINKHNAPVSSWNSFGTNFLVKNFTEAPDRDDPDFYFELCAAYWGTESEAWEREYMIEWDTRHSELLLNSDVQGSFSGSNIIDAWPVSLTAGYTYTFTLSITSLVDSDDYPGGADLHLFLIKDTGQWLNQDDAVYDLEVHHATSASAGGEYVVGTSAGGNYVVVVVNNSASYEYLGDPRPQGDYVIHIEGSAAPSDMPNLVVDSIGVGNPVVDSPVTIGFYVKNVGDAAAGASESQVTVDGVVQCASIAVNPLASGDVDSQTCTVPALQAGSHSVTVCANSGNSVDEGNENDNCLQRDFVVQEAYTPRPDLKLKSVGPVSAVEGENVHVIAFVENIGDAPAPASVGRVWVGQTLICDGTLHLDALVAGEKTFTDYCNIGPLDVGTHTLTVYVNNPSSFDEDSTDNNYLDNVTITITPAPKPDLVVEDIYPLEVTEHQEFSLSVVVKNQGQATAAECTGRFLLDQHMIWYATIPSLASGEEYRLTMREGSGWNAGTHPLTFTVDYNDQVDEGSEMNNALGVDILVRPHIAKVYPDGHGTYPTIQSAVDAVTPGGTVQLVTGTYSGDGNRDINFHGRNVIVRGADGIGSTIDCQAGAESHVAFILANQEKVEISNIRMINGGNEFFGGALYCSGPVRAIIKDCIFEDNVANVGGAIDARAGADLTIRRCQFLSDRGNTNSHGGGAIHGDDVTLAIYDTLFWKNRGGAISLFNSQLAIRNATFDANDDGLVLDGDYTQLDMKRTIVSDSSGQALINLTGHGYYVTCSDFYNNSGGDWLGGPDSSKGQISSDPLYCDPDHLDFSLHADSPCALSTCGFMGAFPIGCGSASDTDNDGMDDNWERTYFGDLNHTGADDADNDGVSNYEEFVHGTDPTQSDTDHDGMPDGFENKYDLNPMVDDAFLDADGDGACNLREYVGGSSPRWAASRPAAMDIQVSVGAIGNPIQIGTSELPFATIQQGIDMATSGDTVRVRPGIYTGAGNRDINVPGDKDVILRSADGPGTTTIDCDNLGQGIHVYSGSASFLLEGFTISNGLTNWGGGLYIRSRPNNIEIKNCRFVDNQANHGGGAVGVYGTTAVFTDCAFTGNTAHQNGGAVHVEDSTITLRNCTFTNNHSILDANDNYGSGGAVYAHINSGLNLVLCNFKENIADRSGGGVSVISSDLSLVSAKFIANQAAVNGGAMFCDGSATGTQLVNSFFLGNHAAGDGGGLFMKNTDTLQLIHLTFSQNTADANGAPAYFENCTNAVLRNSIISGQAGDEFILDGSGLETSYSDTYNCNYVVTGGAGITYGAGQISNDPLLTWDGHLPAASPCLDTGSITFMPADTADLDEDGDTSEPLPFDLDGGPRVQLGGDAVDMGCYEYGRGLLAVYSNGVEMLEGPIFHGYSHDCGATGNNIYQNLCTPLAQSPVNWAWEGFSVQWKGYLYAPVSGIYTISSHNWVDGNVLVKIDGKTIADVHTGGGGYSGQVNLSAGFWVPVSISFSSNGGSNNMILGWTVPGKSWEMIPRKYLAASDKGLKIKKHSSLLLSLPAILHTGAMQSRP